MKRIHFQEPVLTFHVALQDENHDDTMSSVNSSKHIREKEESTKFYTKSTSGCANKID